MCIAVGVKSGAPPDLATLRLMEDANPHGGGIAWVHDKSVRWRKGIDAEEMAKLIKDFDIKAPCIVHFRIATVGKSDDKELCHPFPISKRASTCLHGNADRVLAHNGHWGTWGKELVRAVRKSGVRLGGKWSDTRTLAWLAKISDSDEVLDKSYQKIVTLDKFGNLLFFGSGWFEDGGFKMSNRIWEPTKTQYTRYDFRNDNWNDSWRKTYSMPNRVREVVSTLYSPFALSFSSELKKARERAKKQMEEKEKKNAAIDNSEIERQTSQLSLTGPIANYNAVCD